MVRYSQNFLVNGKIADFIVEQAGLIEDDVVLEIGHGKGILTGRMLTKSSVVAVEIDPELCETLGLIFPDEVESSRLRIICGDALKLRLPDFTKVVSNMPYHISSPLLFRLLEHDFSLGILMFQREFAERLCARPGSKKYGRLSVMMYYYGKAMILKYVKRGNFIPVPKVDSAIVRIVKNTRFCYDKIALDRVVRRIFEQRRKKIKNILGNVPYGDKRAEELTPEQICEVTEYVKGRIFD